MEKKETAVSIDPVSMIEADTIADVIGGRYRYYLELQDKAATLHEHTQARLESMSWHAWMAIIAIGEDLLEVEERYPGEWEMWFDANRRKLGFGLRKAQQFRSRARRVREIGAEEAYTEMLRDGSRRKAAIRISFYSMRSVEEWGDLDVDRARERLRPIVPLVMRLFPEMNISITG